jgi:hypothetical protein
MEVKTMPRLHTCKQGGIKDDLRQILVREDGGEKLQE